MEKLMEHTHIYIYDYKWAMMIDLWGFYPTATWKTHFKYQRRYHTTFPTFFMISPY